MIRIYRSLRTRTGESISITEAVKAFAASKDNVPANTPGNLSKDLHNCGRIPPSLPLPILSAAQRVRRLSMSQPLGLPGSCSCWKSSCYLLSPEWPSTDHSFCRVLSPWAFRRLRLMVGPQQLSLLHGRAFHRLAGWRMARDPDDGPRGVETRRDNDVDDVCDDAALLW